ncbi:uncharacterized protein LOC111217156 isoform X2 [Seriola dumerili]|uniref:uncharacterized protein LOC111217156 isoform X2 n=1 Tax=Seriola dumerili TaxID=41447 RepID=UPI000BBE5946|nr:uncharacterized protein LOC111217156 isoform X2 [Seriola dumerili]
MNYSQPFSLLNESLRPRCTTSEQLYSSLNRMEDKQLGSLRSRSSSYRPTVLPAEPEPRVYVTSAEPDDPEEPEDEAEQEDFVCDGFKEGNCADLLSMSNSILITEMNLKGLSEEELADEDSGSSHSEEKDNQGELNSEESVSVCLASEGGKSLQRSYINGTLPDLLKNGRPLSRRRTLGHVSDTVTEEVLSVLRLLHPLTESESSTPEPSPGENCLDAALAQLQSVARKLAISNTKQEFKSGQGKGAEDIAILQQALRDRDEAIEKKKAMEDELLRSKTDMMTLNNQLLEAVQKRLEMSLELEAWKEDVQLMLQQQLRIQQEAEQAQKKPSRLGILRRNNRPPVQRPSNFPLSAPAPPTTNSSQIFISRAAVSAPSTSPSTSTQRNWRDKLKRGKSSRQGEDAVGQDSEYNRDDSGFQVVSLD